MGVDFHGLHYRITSIRRILISVGNCQPIYKNVLLHSIEKWREECYGLGQNLPERSLKISWPTIEHSVRSGL
jgi:hypothetical protein